MSCLRPAVSRTVAAAFTVALTIVALAPRPVHAQPGAPRIWVSGWAGRFTTLGGFSDGELDAFFRFDDATSFGGGVHVAVSPGLVVGADVLYARPTYERFNRDDASVEGAGDAKVGSALASARLAAGGGVLGLYLTGGAGMFAWDLEDPDLDEGWDLDLALNLGAGLEWTFNRRARLFGEYSQWWVYHQKDEAVQSNSPNHNLLRFGARLGI